MTEHHTVHSLRTWPDPFDAIWEGRKTSEFRKDDRGFEVGNLLLLEEWKPDEREPDCLHETFGRHLGRFILATITDIRRGPDFGIPEDHAMLSMRRHIRGRWDGPWGSFMERAGFIKPVEFRGLRQLVKEDTATTLSHDVVWLLTSNLSEAANELRSRFECTCTLGVSEACCLDCRVSKTLDYCVSVIAARVAGHKIIVEDMPETTTEEAPE